MHSLDQHEQATRSTLGGLGLPISYRSPPMQLQSPAPDQWPDYQSDQA